MSDDYMEVTLRSRLRCPEGSRMSLLESEIHALLKQAERSATYWTRKLHQIQDERTEHRRSCTACRGP